MTSYKKRNIPIRSRGTAGSGHGTPVRGNGRSTGRTIHPTVTPSPSANPYLSGVVNPKDTGAGSLFDYLSTGQMSPFIEALSNQNKNSGDFKTNFSGILGRFSGNSDISQLLNALGVNNDKDMSDSAAEDWNKQLLETLLNYNLTQENRTYNEGLRDEQRLYDSPTNLLARLMGAGISRDAAIQMLNGAGSGSGPVPYSDAVAAAQGIPASESDLNQLYSRSQIANTVFNGVSCLSGLVNMGFGAAQAVEQTIMLRNQNHLTRGQVKAYDATGEAYSIMQSANASADAYKNVDSVGKFLTDAASKGNSAALSFINSGKLNDMRRHAPFSTRYMTDLFQNEHNSDMYLSAMRKMVAETGLVNEQTAKTAQETVNARAQFDVISQSADFIEEQTRTQRELTKVQQQMADKLVKEGKLIEAQTYKTNAETLYVEEQTTALDYQNQLTENVMTTHITGADGRPVSGFELMTSNQLYELNRDAYIAMKTNDPDYLEHVFLGMLNDAQKVEYLNLLEAFQASAGIEFCNQYPELFNTYNAYKSCGIYDFMHAVAEGNYTIGQMQSFMGASTSRTGVGNSSIEIFNNLPTITK